ncbi:MAG: 5'-methylthioadenosine/adenosylhomocysteine nucleosidase [Candidatus Izemoplasmatales bacterium]|nr:5'-methylthioadenosine/adenosylhomocysteine nucleosidase [Candidatus Izemoplasmatales bacterium]
MIGIIGAMQKEIEILLDAMTIVSQVNIADKTFYQGKLSGKDVVVVQSGIGKVNAAMTATALLMRFDVEYVINIGLAGGLKPSKVGEIVLASGITYFDVSLEAIDDLPFGQMANDPFQVRSDDVLLQKAKFVFTDLNVPWLTGRIVSGDTFVTDISLLNRILPLCPDALAVEMEGMAIGLACYKFGIKFLSIRGISDVIGATDQQVVYQNVSERIAHTTAGFVIRFLELS